jgi:hypothetical protein
MFKKAWLVGLIVGAAVATAPAAELKMQWEGQTAGDLTTNLAVGNQAVIQIYITLLDGEIVNSVFYTNDSAPDINQVGVAGNDALDWTSGSTDGPLGGGNQQVALGAASIGSDLVGPGEFLIGTQTVELTGGTTGQAMDITFDVNFPIGVVSDTGSFFSRVASESVLADSPGVYHLGTGSPGYTAGGADDTPEPLIVDVGSDGGGGGGGGAPPPGDDDTGDDDTGDDDTGDDDTGDDDTGDDDTGDDDTGDDDTGDDDSGGGAPPPGDDDDAGDDDDDSGAGGGGTNRGGSAPSAGPCGVGLLGALPFGLFGWLMMALHRRR